MRRFGSESLHVLKEWCGLRHMQLQGFVLFIALALKRGRPTASLDTRPMETASVQADKQQPWRGLVSGQAPGQAIMETCSFVPLQPLPC